MWFVFYPSFTQCISCDWLGRSPGPDWSTVPIHAESLRMSLHSQIYFSSFPTGFSLHAMYHSQFTWQIPFRRFKQSHWSVDISIAFVGFLNYVQKTLVGLCLTVKCFPFGRAWNRGKYLKINLTFHKSICSHYFTVTFLYKKTIAV